MRLSAPGKTFLFGEYVALGGGPAMLLCTEPRFQLIAHKSKPNLPLVRKGLCEKGPVAGLFEESELRNYDLEFQDPHQGQGGFGGSSGQYLLLFALLQKIRKKALLERDLLEHFRRMTKESGGVVPSGYDLVAQMLGKVSLIDRQRDEVLVTDWKLDSLDFLLVRTGIKVPTHEHLSRLNSSTFRELEIYSREAKESFLSSNKESFLRAIRGFRDQLIREGFASGRTLELIPKIESLPGVYLAKGCGALGADVICALVEPEMKNTIRKHVEEMNLVVVADKASLSIGLASQDTATKRSSVNEELQL